MRIIPVLIIVLVMLSLGLWIVYSNRLVNHYNHYKTSLKVTVDNDNGGILLLMPPPATAIRGGYIVTQDNQTEPIPPLDTSNVYVLAYYNAGEILNLTQISQLPGLQITRWGFSYFDGIYTFFDPLNAPSSFYDNSTVKIHVRVRSDGWVLTWITKNESLGQLILSQTSLGSSFGKNDPWISKGITTLSYTIFKILLQAQVVNNTDSDGDGIPDDLVSISKNTGYYDYKYAAKRDTYGYIAIMGARSWAYYSTSGRLYGWNYGTFDFTVSNTYTINETWLYINAYIRKGEGIAGYSYAYIKLGLPPNPPEIFSYTTSHDDWAHEEKYYVRYSRNITGLIAPGTTYDMDVYAGINSWGYYGGPWWSYSSIEGFIIVIGVLKQ